MNESAMVDTSPSNKCFRVSGNSRWITGRVKSNIATGCNSWVAEEFTNSLVSG